MIDTLITLAALWMLSGLIPAIIYMVARARKTYYVNIWQPLIGALQGPLAWWVVYRALKTL